MADDAIGPIYVPSGYKVTPVEVGFRHAFLRALRPAAHHRLVPLRMFGAGGSDPACLGHAWENPAHFRRGWKAFKSHQPSGTITPGDGYKLVAVSVIDKWRDGTNGRVEKLDGNPDKVNWKVMGAPWRGIDWEVKAWRIRVEPREAAS